MFYNNNNKNIIHHITKIGFRDFGVYCVQSENKKKHVISNQFTFYDDVLLYINLYILAYSSFNIFSDIQCEHAYFTFNKTEEIERNSRLRQLFPIPTPKAAFSQSNPFSLSFCFLCSFK